MSLRLRLVVILGLSLCLVWALAAVWLARDFQDQVNRTLDDQLAASARMAAALVQQMPEAAWTDPEGPLYSVPTTEGIACQVSTAQGSVIVRTPEGPDGVLAPGESGYGERTVDGTHWRVFTHHADDLAVTTADRLDERYALTNEILLVAAVPFAVALAGSLGLLWWGVRQGLAPLERLRSALAAREPTSLTPVETDRLPAELVPLTQSLNDLLARMDRAFAREQRFTDDAAHELRTPLASIKTHLQVARQASGERASQALSQAEEGTERLARTLTQLLMLARLEGGQSWGAEAAGDPGDIVDRLVNELPATDRSRVAVSGNGAGLRLDAPRELVATALGNLLSNALAHTDAAIPVHVMIDPTDGNSVRFTVEDEGPGIPATDLARLTDRFWRAGTSGGSGLGLSITAAIVDRLGGDLRFDNRLPRGLRGTITLPARRRKEPT